MKIIVGLGNIGDNYEKSRHNVGFMAIDNFLEFLQKEGLEITEKEDKKLKTITYRTNYKENPILLAKPTTFMNLSGEAVSSILNFYKETPENLVVIYDDIDLPLGKIRVREKGSAGTHNGMKSIIQHLGTENFLRIRIGIENRQEQAKKNGDLANYVLSNFNKEEKKVLVDTLEEVNRELEERV